MSLIRHTDDSLNVVYFSQRHPGWHTFKADKRTKRAVLRAKELGRIEVNEFNQFRESAALERQNLHPVIP